MATIYLLMLTAAASASWTHEAATNCYSGHGATDIDSNSIGVLTLGACEQKCTEMADCTGITMEVGKATGNCWRRKDITITSCDSDSTYDTWLKAPAPPSPPGSTVNLMVAGMLGDFEAEGYEGYACSFADWTACVTSAPASCTAPDSVCRKCTSKRGGRNESITCAKAGSQTQFLFPAGGIFPVTQQFHFPPNTAIVGPRDPNDPADKTRQQTNVSAHTWFVIPKGEALCGDDPMCKDKTARAPTACSGDPRTHRQGFLMASNSMLKVRDKRLGSLPPLPPTRRFFKRH